MVATSFDGKSHPRVVRGEDGEAQTLIELSKQHWDQNCMSIKSVAALQDAIKVASEETNGVKRLGLLCLEAVHKQRSEYNKSKQYCWYSKSMKSVALHDLLDQNMKNIKNHNHVQHCVTLQGKCRACPVQNLILFF